MHINQLVTEAHQAAVRKGWWEKPKSPLEVQMLIVSEVAEATEESRKDNPPIWQQGPNGPIVDGHHSWDNLRKPEGELIEMADVVIRIADWCGRNGWDLEKAIKMKMQYNESREHRHGGKKY